MSRGRGPDDPDAFFLRAAAIVIVGMIFAFFFIQAIS